MKAEPVTFLVVGAGGRGTGYAAFALAHPERAHVVGVAEPQDLQRNALVEAHRIPSENVFRDWRDVAQKDRIADAVIIATQDAMHTEPAIAFAEKGYAILLEKPMAPTEEECRKIVAAVKAHGNLFAVCHVLRYTSYTRRLKEVLDAGTIGEVVSMQHLEPVGYWHQAHSFVRGSWRNEGESSSMLLAKSCHDLDWIRYIMGGSCQEVASFGALKHFRAENRPATAGDRCVACDYEPDCPYSALKVYVKPLQAGHTEWPVASVTAPLTEERLMEALREGPYGRCVYTCDNDVVDNQVVIMQFEDGRTANFTMTAFTPMTDRKTRLFGTRGYIEGDGRYIRVYDFLTDRETVHDTHASDGSMLSGHGGGDTGLMDHFTRAVAENDPSHILSGPEETLETHLSVFAAEQSRREKRIVTVRPL